MAVPQKTPMTFKEIKEKLRGYNLEARGLSFTIDTKGDIWNKGKVNNNLLRDEEIVLVELTPVTYGGKRKRRKTKSKTKIRKTKKSNNKFRKTKSRS